VKRLSFTATQHCALPKTTQSSRYEAQKSQQQRGDSFNDAVKSDSFAQAWHMAAGI